VAIPLPTEASDLAALTAALDAADHGTRLEWAYSLGGAQQYHLYALAAGQLPLAPADLHGDDGVVVAHPGRNGLALFSRFEKRFALHGGELVGFNHNDWPGLIGRLARRVTGPGHYRFYASPDGTGEVWIDYRRIPSQAHPDFPPLVDNESGLRQLVFGNMVDVLRRVSTHVFIGDAFKNMPRDDTPPFLTRVASLFSTAPFVLVQPPR